MTEIIKYYKIPKEEFFRKGFKIAESSAQFENGIYFEKVGDDNYYFYKKIDTLQDFNTLNPKYTLDQIKNYCFYYVYENNDPEHGTLYRGWQPISGLIVSKNKGIESIDARAAKESGGIYGSDNIDSNSVLNGIMEAPFGVLSNSFAFGRSITIKGRNSIGVGTRLYSNAKDSATFGQGNFNMGNYSFVAGGNNYLKSNKGGYNAVFGTRNKIVSDNNDGINSFLICGSGNEIFETAQTSAAFGRNIILYNLMNSLVFGSNIEIGETGSAVGNASFYGGYNITIGNGGLHNFVFGNSISLGDGISNSYALGFHLDVKNKTTFRLGFNGAENLDSKYQIIFSNGNGNPNTDEVYRYHDVFKLPRKDSSSGKDLVPAELNVEKFKVSGTLLIDKIQANTINGDIYIFSNINAEGKDLTINNITVSGDINANGKTLTIGNITASGDINANGKTLTIGNIKDITKISPLSGSLSFSEGSITNIKNIECQDIQISSMSDDTSEEITDSWILYGTNENKIRNCNLLKLTHTNSNFHVDCYGDFIVKDKTIKLSKDGEPEIDLREKIKFYDQQLAFKRGYLWGQLQNGDSSSYNYFLVGEIAQLGPIVYGLLFDGGYLLNEYKSYKASGVEIDIKSISHLDNIKIFYDNSCPEEGKSLSELEGKEVEIKSPAESNQQILWVGNRGWNTATYSLSVNEGKLEIKYLSKKMYVFSVVSHWTYFCYSISSNFGLTGM